MPTAPPFLIDSLHQSVSIAGFVRWPDASPADAADVRVSAEAAAACRACVSARDGSFHVDDLPAGDYEVHARQSRVERGRRVDYAACERVSLAPSEAARGKPLRFVDLSLALKGN